MSWFSQWLHPGGAYKGAQEQSEKYYNESKGYRQPYIEQGQNAYQQLQDQINKLTNPAALQDEWSKGYETSPYAKQLQAEAQTGGLDAASAMGLGGSSAALSNIQKGSADIVSKDRQQYMQDLMQKYMASLGLTSGIYNTGANAAGQAAAGASQMGDTSAANKFGEYNSGAQAFGNTAGSAVDLIVSYLTGGMGVGGGGRGAWSPTSSGKGR